MNPSGDTLDIRPLRPSAPIGDLPIAAVQRAEDRAAAAEGVRPQDVAAARARIAELLEPRIQTSTLPSAVHPVDVVTDKQLLAQQAVVRNPLETIAALPQTTNLAGAIGAIKATKAAAAGAKERTASRIPSRFQPVLIAVGIFALTLVAFKAPVIFSQLQYSSNDSSVSLPASVATTVTADPTLVIKKINVNAPVTYMTSNTEADVQKSLENGVIHYAGTAKPGEVGNAVFFGHSSNDWWQPGSYKFVFVLLDKLVVGDTFDITYNSVRYTYQVTGTKVVDPTEVSVLAQTTTPTATLITCSPPGTNWRRLVVSAKQISPDPSAATATTSTSTSGTTTLSDSDKGFFDGLWDTIKNLFGSSDDSSSDSSTSTTVLPGAK